MKYSKNISYRIGRDYAGEVKPTREVERDNRLSLEGTASEYHNPGVLVLWSCHGQITPCLEPEVTGRLTAQISCRCKRSAAFALLGNDLSISIGYSIVPHKFFPSKVQ